MNEHIIGIIRFVLNKKDIKRHFIMILALTN